MRTHTRLVAGAALVALVVLAVPVHAADLVTIHGTLAAWAPAVATARPGDSVVFTSVDVDHWGVVFGLKANQTTGSYTLYHDVPAGTHAFVCQYHAWMVGRLVVR